ncbi:PP2C family protein-serine/threonine phosphatase [Williamsia sterculiae]|uniref:Serine/threonine protein phosphatase PstP n=1 Tax=Williamsia sterculiae TaxID=1344003 RepID=A0A1N7FEQ1_9NOCA|nr:PP2C family serine/threonine-protein phosphatase [Williamsia sterculiae]SIR98760.1 protein phosphatase [Williamsia sterculiae]
MTLVLRYIARSDRGLVRSNNEDSVYAGARLLALADGMGGHAAGEVASQLVIQALRPLDEDEPGNDLLSLLDDATRQGNEAIAAQVQRSPELDGMGTTLTAILFAGNRVGLCHIGDSRGYLLRDGSLTQITRDDTFVQTLVDEGRITAEEAHTHPQRSLIMRALTGAEVEPTLTVRDTRIGDRYLLCSDGLSDVVSEETIADTLGSVSDNKECADRLIELALRGGGPDNVTVVVADVADVDYGEHRPIIGGAAGGDDEEYVPDPRTAAGRAAALRPPREEPRRPDIEAEPIDTRRHPRRKWYVGSGVVLALIVVVAGIFTANSYIRSHYFYVGVQGENVVVYRGMQQSFLGIGRGEVSRATCVRNLNTEAPTIDFVDSGTADADCTHLVLDDVADNSRAAVTGTQPSTSLNEAQDQVRRVEFKPLCKPARPATPAPGQPGTPAPPTTPGAPPTTSPAPTPSTAVSTSAVPSTSDQEPGSCRQGGR